MNFDGAAQRSTAVGGSNHGIGQSSCSIRRRDSLQAFRSLRQQRPDTSGRVTSYKSGGLKRSTQHPARRESVKRKPKKAKAKRRGRSALICMSLQYNELRNCD